MKVNAEGAGLDERSLQRIDDHLLNRYINPGKIAGCQVAVYRHGVLGYFNSFGLADRERNRPVDEGTIFRCYSMTKPIAGVALLMLFERGHFQLTDPIWKLIPEWRNLQVRQRNAAGEVELVAPDRDMTIRDVMMHMSGLGYSATNGDLDLDSVAEGGIFGKGSTLETMAEALGQVPLHAHPGTRWRYSVGMDVCGLLVERITGMRFDDYLRTELFEPLGMVDTAFFVPDDKLDRFAANYARNGRKELVLFDDPERSSYRRTPAFLSGGGGLVSTTADYLRFTTMLLEGGELDGHRILSRKTVELMSSNHLPGGASMASFAQPGGYGEVGFEGMGFGLTVAVSQGPTVSGSAGSAGEFMWGGAASTTFWIDPAEAITAVFMTQLMPSGTFNFGGQLKSLVYGAFAD